METNISRFLKEKEMSESTRKSYITLFKNIEAHETTINRTIEDWSKEDCLNMLSSLNQQIDFDEEFEDLVKPGREYPVIRVN